MVLLFSQNFSEKNRKPASGLSDAVVSRFSFDADNMRFVNQRQNPRAFALKDRELEDFFSCDTIREF